MNSIRSLHLLPEVQSCNIQAGACDPPTENLDSKDAQGESGGHGVVAFVAAADTDMRASALPRLGGLGIETGPGTLALPMLNAASRPTRQLPEAA